MTQREKVPKTLAAGSSDDRITVNGFDFQWDTREGMISCLGQPVALMWIDTTLAGLMSGLAATVGPERFSLALQASGRDSVESDWEVISDYPNFREGFEAVSVLAAVSGWGNWQLVEDNPDQCMCRFRADNSWEGLYQKKLNTCWGTAMLAGKLAGYCSKRFGVSCWATQTSFIAKGDPYDEFTVAVSSLNVEEEVEKLLDTDLATRADMAVALTRLRSVQAELLEHQGNLESLAEERTEELATSFEEVRTANERLQREVEEHARAAEALKRNEEFTTKLIDRAPMSMAVVNMDGSIESINQKAIKTFGYFPEDIPTMDQWWVKAYPNPEIRCEARDRWMGYINTAIEQNEEIQYDEYSITCKDGSVIKVGIFGVLVGDRVFVMFDDITLQALREDLLLRSNADLEVRVQKRTAELAERNLSLERTTAHLRELAARLARVEENERTRMAQIVHDQLQQILVAARFGLSVLRQKLTEDHQVAAAETVRKAIEDALEESRSLVVRISPPVLREGGLAPAMKWLRTHMLETHGLTVEVDVDKSAQAIEKDMRTTIFRAVRELLFNVIKHSGVTSADVLITVLPDSQVQVVVADQGKGYTPSNPDQHENLDTGFGLPAIRERFESLGGHMGISSVPGHGCRVTLTVPANLSLPTGPGRPGGMPVPDDRSTRQLTSPVKTDTISLLLADDHAMLREGLSKLLSQQTGYEIVGEAADGEAAVQQAGALRPDVVLMDFNMPGLNGIEATRIIHDEFPDMIVIGLSMYAEPHRAEEMRQAGAAAYVAKTEAAETLVATINACCGRFPEKTLTTNHTKNTNDRCR